MSGHPSSPEASAASAPVRRASPSLRRVVVGLLSALVPGLGHARVGRRGEAVLFAAPVLVALLVPVVLAATSDPVVLATRMVDPNVLAVLLVVQLGVLAWRVLAVVSSVRAVDVPTVRLVDRTVIALLLAIVVLPQAALGYATVVAREEALQIFAPGERPSVWIPPNASPSFVAGAPSLLPSASGSPSPTPQVPRVTILLIGMDSGVGRNTALTDTMIVASLDPVARTVSMLSIPRDMVDVPLPDGRIYRGKINGLVSWVRHHPSDFPGSHGDGQAVLAAAISELLRIRIDYWAQVDLRGFISLVDSVGGVNVMVERGFCDPTYDEYGLNGFGIPVGRWHLDGAHALAYARVRKASGENDFTRASRQQQVIVAIRDRIVRGGFLEDPIRFLRSLGDTVQTTVPARLLPDYVDLARRIDGRRVYRAVIERPLIRGAQGDPRGSILIPNVRAIRRLSVRLFPPTGTLPRASERPPTERPPTGRAPVAPSTGCRPAPPPTPRSTPPSGPAPTPRATHRPTPTPAPTPTPPEQTPSPDPDPTEEPTPTP
jgi:LCP family protein required for cell wall assembly